MIVDNIKAVCRKRGAELPLRDKRLVRNSLVLAFKASDQRYVERAKLLMKNFLEVYTGRLKFEKKIRALPAYLYRWG